MRAGHVLLALVFGSTSAAAQNSAAPMTSSPTSTAVTSTETETEQSRLWLGPQLDLMPSGSFELSANGNSASADAGSAIGLGGIAEYRLSPLVSIGLAPRFVVPVKVQDASDSGWQLDLRGRVAVGNQVAPKIYVHGIGTLGYSAMMHVVSVTDANGMPAGYKTSSGLVVGFGAGLRYEIGPRLSFAGEVTYQFGFQGTTIKGVDVLASDNYLTLGFGLIAAIM